MLSLSFSRQSVCMGDDAGNGEYTLSLPDDAALGDLMHVLLHGGCGNDWPIPYTGANSFWAVRSDAGRLGTIQTDSEGEWHITCSPYPESTPLKQLGLTRVFCGRDYDAASEQYSEQDLRHASEFRDAIHAQALAKLRETHPEIDAVVDRWPVEAYFQRNWDYPGRWYTIVAIPKESRSRKELIETIVRDTLAQLKENPGCGKKIDAAHYEYEKLFTVSVDQNSRSCMIVGRDAQGRSILESYEEYSLGSATGSVSAYYVLTDEEFRRYAKKALANCCITPEDYARFCAGQTPEKDGAPRGEAIRLPEAKPFTVFYEDYPRADADIYIVKDTEPCRGLASHRRALSAVCRALSVPEEDGAMLHFDAGSARGWPVSADAPFLPAPTDDAATLRKAVLDPPHGCRYTAADFDALCAKLFPKGRSRLEVFEWSTDWSDYFEDGHEWWGAMCYTVYDRSMDRYAVLLASSTD